METDNICFGYKNTTIKEMQNKFFIWIPSKTFEREYKSKVEELFSLEL